MSNFSKNGKSAAELLVITI